MILELQLVPQSAFYKNLRNQMGAQWNTLSKKIRAEHHHTCEYCGWKEDRSRKLYTHIHEVWEYDHENCTQKLVKFVCICPFCHGCHHWGLSQIQGKNMVMLKRHAMKVNQCSEAEWDRHVSESFTEWKNRSDIVWMLDLGEYKSLVKG